MISRVSTTEASSLKHPVKLLRGRGSLHPEECGAGFDGGWRPEPYARARLQPPGPTVRSGYVRPVGGTAMLWFSAALRRTSSARTPAVPVRGVHWVLLSRFSTNPRSRSCLTRLSLRRGIGPCAPRPAAGWSDAVLQDRCSPVLPSRDGHLFMTRPHDKKPSSYRLVASPDGVSTETGEASEDTKSVQTGVLTFCVEKCPGSATAPTLMSPRAGSQRRMGLITNDHWFKT